MARGGGLDTLLRDLTDRAVREVPGVAACSVTVRRADRLMTLAGSAGLPSGLDQRQYENESGPCVDASETGEVQYAPDLARESRWPGYTPQALAAGVHSVLALPLVVEGEAGAALNLYATGPGALEAGREAAESLAARAADMIDTALRIEAESASAADVRLALLSRSVIDQAVGILMARERLDAAAALGRLRRVSQDRNVKLRDLAADLVAGASGPSRPAGTARVPQPPGPGVPGRPAQVPRRSSGRRQ